MSLPFAFPVRRRRLVANAAAGLIAGPLLLRPEGGFAHVQSGPREPLPAGLFTLGVASGDPLPNGVVIWTRLAPDPLNGGGMPDRTVPVAWEVAEDARFRRVRRRGVAFAEPALGHAVHVDVRGLRAGADYHYRFRAGTEISPAGRTRTAPDAHAWPERLRFAFASCQDYQSGRYTAHRHLADEDLDFVAFLGDYIYEGAPNPNAFRQHDGTGEPYGLVEYRNRHARYKSDPDLQAAHATYPWIVTLDDHEIDNNWADEVPQDPALQTPEAFRARRIAAFQAYYEHMPLRRASVPRGLDMQLYRRLRFGNLASVHVLDTRQYRSDQPTSLAAAQDPALSMTGPTQEEWLVRGLGTSGTRWNLLANQVMWAQNDRRAGPETVFDFDNWDGYRAQRRRLLEFFGTGRVQNPVVLTGDRHCTWVCDLRPDFDDPASPVVGAELTGTSISSGGNPDTAAFHATFDPIMAESPHWKYIDNRRGYVVCDVSAREMRSRLRVVDDIWTEGSPIYTAAEFVTEAGRPGVSVASQETSPLARSGDYTGPVYDVQDDNAFPLRP
ncbi:alkaline phosphatase D family protein [Catenuloplanes atrovinosus]|uniref:Alkaline phosphatase D n=1 Tax=Catenuloplanes atrovinosus TaxID=137266 RepID=A0AAE4CCM8_9ACTN|nr:alkaline phosphatase D family protein [Catenuloplanes atrovinosus]MDR7279343.1 alkaline phosphatase D [Catenuloplanes atrovinosus]